jgi:hypothetical protein
VEPAGISRQMSNTRFTASEFLVCFLHRVKSAALASIHWSSFGLQRLPISLNAGNRHSRSRADLTRHQHRSNCRDDHALKTQQNQRKTSFFEMQQAGNCRHSNAVIVLHSLRISHDDAGRISIATWRSRHVGMRLPVASKSVQLHAAA